MVPFVGTVPNVPDNTPVIVATDPLLAMFAWLCVQGMCDEKGNPLFTIADVTKLNEKSGAPIGWIAAEIVKFSDMARDAEIARGEITPEKALEEDIKNS